MFDEPQTKRISREDLFSPSTSAPHSPNFISLSLEFTEIPPTHPQTHSEAEADDGEGGEDIPFPLFSTTTTVRLRSPTPLPDPYKLAVESQRRPEGYYAPTPTQLDLLRTRAADVAVSGDDIVAFALRSLKHLHDCGSGGAAVVEEKGRRKRPGKKRRKHLRVLRGKEEARRRSIAGLEKYKGLTVEEKAEVAKCERARKNREKKIRERAKRRALREVEKAEGG